MFWTRCAIHQKGMEKDTDYGRQMNPFFTEIQNFWAWVDKLGTFGGIFRPNYQQPFWFSESLLQYLYKKN